MSSIATCPQCAAQLAVPESASANNQAQCPECRAEFLLAEGDLRFLSAARIVEPIAPTSLAEPPAPIEPEFAAPEPATDSDETSADETSLAEPKLPQDIRNAETLSSPTTLSGWEERLRTAIDSTEESSPTNPQLADALTEKISSLEESPEFEFVIDPPVESPADSFTPTSQKLPEPADWSETSLEQSSEEVQTTAVQSPAVEEPIDAHQPAPARRTKNSLLKRATVVVTCGAVGILVGQYALLWLRGPSADYLHLAQFVPAAIFPSAQSQVFAPQISVEEHLVSDDTQDDTQNEEPTVEQPADEMLADGLSVDRELVAAAEPPTVKHDEFVEPATAQLPEAPAARQESLLPSTHTTPTDFKQLLVAASSSSQILQAGNLSDENSIHAMGQAYIALCRLAERADFIIEADSNDPGGDQGAAAAGLFRAAANRASKSHDLSQVMARWWQHDSRPTQGILLVGRVESVETVGSYALCQLSLDVPDAPLVPVLLAERRFQVGDQIGVVGTIVAQPHRLIAGPAGDLPQLAVAVESFSLPAK